MNRGYTILELLVVLLIIGLFVSFGYASFREFSNRQLVINYQRQLASDLRFAQSQALAGRKPSECVGVLRSYSFRISGADYFIEANCNSNISIKRATLNSRVTLSTNFGSSTAISSLYFYTQTGKTNITSGESKTIDLTICQPRPVPPYNCVDLVVGVQVTNTGYINTLLQ